MLKRSIITGTVLALMLAMLLMPVVPAAEAFPPPPAWGPPGPMYVVPPGPPDFGPPAPPPHWGPPAPAYVEPPGPPAWGPPPPYPGVGVKISLPVPIIWGHFHFRP
ncbi:MAG: hypothetical protein SFH39_11365 [Candidatus Magnetobacterium sp. LHC-1]|nr:hypothetical protein [Nitrospirota bacterium]